MSGDVQPRKRKDKKRKKDELGVEEHRGTAAVLGEGDVLMHSHHDHGTGGHWCAKIIFFSLLAVLVTLIGLIILENRGLSELEANSVESRYSGVLEGWLEDAPEDDHHDEHTLELKHHDDDDGHGDDLDDNHEDIEHEEEDDHDEVDQDDEESQEQDLEEADDEDETLDNSYENNEDDEDIDEDLDNEDDMDEEQEPADDEDEFEDENRLQEDDDDEEDSDHQDEDNENNYESDNNDENTNEIDDNDDLYDGSELENIRQNNDVDRLNENEDNEKDDSEEHENEDDEEVDHHEEEETDEEVERIEREVPDEEPVSVELPALPEAEDDDDDKEEEQESSHEETLQEDDGDIEDEEFLEPDDDDDDDLPIVEHITVPAGKPLVEVEEDVSSEQPPDTLAEEEEYERRQEELRREEENASNMWLKLTVGGALLVATHAVMRRATSDRAEAPSDDHGIREETPSLTDRRMTLIPEEPTLPVSSKNITQETSQPIVKETAKRVAQVIKEQDILPADEQEIEEEDEEVEDPKVTEDRELYSEEDEPDEEEDVEIPVIPKKDTFTSKAEQNKDKLTSVSPKVEKSEPEPESEEEVADDVEIIDDEQIDEELEEEDEEEEISDVDDAELLNRLEAKYGRLPEPERPQPKHKDGGNSILDDWPGEPSDAYWRQQLDKAEEELRQGEWSAALKRVGGPELQNSARARYITARSLDLTAEARRDNNLLSKAITAYIHLLKMNEHLSDKKLLEITSRTLDRIQFRGNYLNAEPIYRLLIRRFPNEPHYRNNLTVSFLMANRADLAEESLKETLKLWPNDRVALAHYAFVLKTLHNKLEEAVGLFQKALKGDTGPACEPRFYYHLGDALLLLGRFAEAHEVHKRGASLGHFLSASQRSLYNVPRLKGRPWWSISQTPYEKLALALEKSWKEILKEGEAARALYEAEKEGLRERGEWSQLDLFVRGREIPGRCKQAPVTCSIVRAEPAAVGCRRGQVKFSSIEPGTHVRPHVGPTNCRLRMHLGLSNTKDTYIRVDKEIRQWQVGKVLLFDDSYEHEVWHNGTGSRLVLIVDVWHPDLTPAERRQLPAI